MKDKWDGELEIVFDRDFFDIFSAHDNRHVLLGIERKNNDLIKNIYNVMEGFFHRLKGVMSFPEKNIVRIEVKEIIEESEGGESRREG